MPWLRFDMLTQRVERGCSEVGTAGGRRSQLVGVRDTKTDRHGYRVWGWGGVHTSGSCCRCRLRFLWDDTRVSNQTPIWSVLSPAFDSTLNNYNLKLVTSPRNEPFVYHRSDISSVKTFKQVWNHNEEGRTLLNRLKQNNEK